MLDPWPEFLERFAPVLQKPQRDWSSDESADVWAAAARAVAGYLRQVVRSKVGDEAIAEEIVQLLLVELSLSRTFEPRRRGSEAFRTWVHSCLHNHVVRHFKSVTKEQRLGRRVDDDVSALELPTHSVEIAAAEARRDLERMFAILKPRARYVLRQRLNGASDTEIAIALSISSESVRQIAFQAIRDLRKVYGHVDAGILGPRP
jgi:RNA polymerase sigma factor (sigma-70 family)